MAGSPKKRAKRELQAAIEAAQSQATWEQEGEATNDGEGTLVVRDEYPPPFHKPTDKQVEFFQACWDPNAEEVLFDGAIRSGKTQAACKMIASWAWHYGGPNWKFVIMRRTYRELEDSTKAAFLRGDGKMPPGCPPALIPDRGYKAKDEMVVLRNGAQILFRSAENPAETEDKLRNVTVAGFFIDQVEELGGDEYFHMYETLLSRMSDPRGPRKALLVANPGPEDHWVYKRFVDPTTREPWTRRVHVKLDENAWNLPESYVAQMNRRETTNNMWFRRFILGEWGAFGGKRFPVWDPKIHVCEPFTVPADWEIVCGIDYGWTNPTAVVWCAIDFEGRWWVVAEHAESEKPVSFHARAIKRIEDEQGISPSSIWMDPSTWARRSEYESPALEFADYGVFAARAQNDRLGGWNRIDEMLSETMDDGLPRLRIFNTCTGLIKELPNLKIKEGTDDVDKVNDHLSDALRYCIVSRMPSPVREEEEDQDLGTRLARRLMERHERRERDIYLG